jgi:hypothetical protein
MKWRRVLLAGSSFVIACSTHHAEERSDAPASLVATWRLVAATAWTASGVPELPLGPTPSGYVVFDASDHVFVQLTRPAVSGDSLQAAASAAAFSGFFGTFDVGIGATSQLRMRVEGSNDAAYVGTTQIREFRLAGDTLTVGLPGKYELRLARVATAR